MDYQSVGEQVKACYRDQSARYRQDDEIEITTEAHRRLRDILARISGSFDHPIQVLDMGCGTGRYFYCLQKVRRLVGVDLSPEMLEAAAHPVREAEVGAAEIELVCANVFEASFPPGSFDFIYSLGMFGFGCPVTAELCTRFFQWLAPGGTLFFDAIDREAVWASSRPHQRVRDWIYPFLPRRLQQVLDKRDRLPMFDLAAEELESLMRATPFRTFAISSSLYRSPVWETVKLECHALKPA